MEVVIKYLNCFHQLLEEEKGNMFRSKKKFYNESLQFDIARVDLDSKIELYTKEIEELEKNNFSD